MNWRARLPERPWSTFLKLGLVSILAAAAFDGTRGAVAQDSDGEPESTPAPATDDDVVIREEHVPGTPWPDEPGAIAFELLSPAEQDAIMRQAEWVDTGAYGVTQAWSTYAHEAAASAEAQRAAHLSGLNGTEDIGVSR